MKYMILVNASQQDYDEMARWSPADFAAMGQFMEQGRGSEAVVTDGPYAETQEVLAGYWIVECESFDRATEIAARLTRTPGPGNAERGYADIRPIAGSRSDL
jgi:hypothetical protein